MGSIPPFLARARCTLLAIPVPIAARPRPVVLQPGPRAAQVGPVAAQPRPDAPQQGAGSAQVIPVAAHPRPDVPQQGAGSAQVVPVAAQPRPDEPYQSHSCAQAGPCIAQLWPHKPQPRPLAAQPEADTAQPGPVAASSCTQHQCLTVGESALWPGDNANMAAAPGSSSSTGRMCFNPHTQGGFDPARREAGGPGSCVGAHSSLVGGSWALGLLVYW